MGILLFYKKYDNKWNSILSLLINNGISIVCYVQQYDKAVFYIK